MAKARSKQASKTAAPLPSEAEILEFVQSQPGRVGKREIARAFHIRGADRIALKKRLKRMAEEGLITSGRKRLREPGTLPPVAVLEVTALDENGEPLAVPVSWDEDERGPAPPVLIVGAVPSARALAAPAVGERVLARIEHTAAHEAHGYDYEGRVIRRISARAPRVFGIFRKNPAGGGRLEPIQKKLRNEIVIPAGAEAGSADGELVEAELQRGRAFGLPRGRVAERIGPIDREAALTTIAIAEHSLPHRFPDAVLAESEALAPTPRDHRDLRELPFVTIDPEDARDHDDAVWARPLGPAERPEGFEVLVAIADVALHVAPGSALDSEAHDRGNSVYFPDRVVPMLPERLSAELCSLKPGVERPALVVRMRFDREGTRRDHDITRAVIRSAARLSYRQAQAAIDGNPDETTEPLLGGTLAPLWSAYGALAAARARRAPLELDLPERRILFDEAGRISGIMVPPRLDAHRLIEEFMIQANVAVADTLHRLKAPAINRFHDIPADDKIAALNDFLSTLDLKFPKSGTIRPALFNRLLDKVRGSEVEHLVSEIVLRTQAQAVYSAVQDGHFGLNLSHYVHFTSPIRRYADLVVHRSLIAALELGAGGLTPSESERLSATAEHISQTERRAMAAERDTVDRMTAAYLAGHVGATFSGRISGMTGAGLFVELAETGADGFVPVSRLGEDYFWHDDRTHRMRGERTGETFALGDPVQVRLVEVSAAAGALRFELLSKGRIEKAKARPAKGARAGKRRPPRRRTRR